MTIERYENDRRMSRAVVAGETVYLCGQVGDPGEDIGAQTAGALRKIETLLQRYGSDREHILYIQIFLSDMSNFDAMNAVYDSWVIPGCQPVRACLEAKMCDPGYLVEIIAIAAKR